MCPPDYFTVRDVKNPFMASGDAVDAELARRQWETLRAAFESIGVSTLAIEPVPDLEDMVFAANQAFAGRGSNRRRFIVPSRMRYASREREVPYYVDWFVRHGFSTIDLGLDAAAGEFLEGHGDLLQHPGSPQIWAGYGWRSSDSGVARFAGAMQTEGLEVTPLRLVDETFYHLDTCFSPLNAEAALVYPGALAPESLERLRAGWKRLYEVPREDAAAFACNGVVANGRFVASHVSTSLAETLRRENLEPAIVDTSEFEKAGGSVFCLTCAID
jgi:arginine dihydrolase